MVDDSYAVAGIGNAIVDVLAHADDARLTALGLDKGVMTLIDAIDAEALYAKMGPGQECSGGSAANTIAGIAALGGRAAFIGKVGDDVLGQVFRHDLSALGVHFPTIPAKAGRATARCLVFVTPDGHRTMQTYLGACIDLAPEDVDEEAIARARVTYLEGYLWDPPRAKEAFRKAARIAHEAGRQVALSLSDPFCVERHRAEFLDLVAQHVDILFANEVEIASLFETDFDSAARAVKELCSTAVLTRSALGSVVVSGEQTVFQAAFPVERVVDTTGAGDLYAAGFLHGLTQGFDLGRSAALGSLCASEIIGHVGARPIADLASLAANAGLLSV